MSDNMNKQKVYELCPSDDTVVQDEVRDEPNPLNSEDQRYSILFIAFNNFISISKFFNSDSQ